MTPSPIIRLLLAAGIILGGAATIHAQEPAQDGDILRVFMNHARVLRLDRPVSKVIVGNSEVADATVADPTTIVVTGRSFGTTNLVLLDIDGNAIADERILVSIDEGNTLRMYRQTNRVILSCTPSCEQHSDIAGATTTP